MIREPDFFDSLVIVGDEAWSRSEWEARIRSRKRLLTPEQKEQRRLCNREYYRRNRERINRENREWKARHRPPRIPRILIGPPPRLVGSLHSLACTGPIKASGCRCHKVRMYDKPPRPALRVAK